MASVAAVTDAASSSSATYLAFVAPIKQHRSSSWHALMMPRQQKRIAPITTTLHSNSAGDEDDMLNNPESNEFYNDFEDLVEQQLSSPILPSSNISKPQSPSRTKQQQQQSSSISSAPDPSFFSSLLKRQQQLQQSSRELLEQWTSGSAKTFAAFTINEQFYIDQQEQQQSKYNQKEELPFDWIRRISIGTYPRVACGSAHGSIYVADVESEQLVGVARNVHSSHHNDNANGVDALDETLRRYLYGEYDGGGVLSVAMYGTNFVASSGREGGVKLFKLMGDEGELTFVGDVPSLKRPLPGVTPILVTCLKFDSLGRLFMGGQDGFLRMVTFADDVDEMQVTLVSSPRQQQLQQLQQLPSPVLSLDISEELEMVATAHANGNICVHSTNQDHRNSNNNNCLLGVWNPFTASSHARSVAFVSGGEDEQDDPLWGIVAGGGNGELWMQEIDPSYILTTTSAAMTNDNRDVAATTTIPLFKENSIQQIEPNHQHGAVLSMAARPGGILVSTGHDGMLRMTQLWPTPKALYGLGGYKVWIGNVCIDSEGKRLLSDGRDDVVVVHDFSMDEEEEEEE